MRRNTIREAFRRDLVIPAHDRRAHASQYPGYWGRAARSLEQAFGDGHRYLTIEEKRARGLSVGAALFLALACAAVIGFYLAVRG